jgi:hypothetical protein
MIMYKIVTKQELIFILLLYVLISIEILITKLQCYTTITIRN